MGNEQSIQANISVQSQTLGEILSNHYELLLSFDGEIDVRYNGVTIKLEDKDDSFCLRNQKNVVSELCHVIKQNTDGNIKPIIKELKKAKKDIINEAICDWTYIDTCVGELAKEMFVIEKEMAENVKVDLDQLATIEKFIYTITFKNGVCEETHDVVYKN